ncbi:MAG: hypothetical protein KDB65_02165 [Calditrichaeota bacterium]|nr:hypothetical protein [Calditrichota bacterium]MCB9369940.1 hypothetical protein [Calditrichota bacterium]
MRSFIVSTIVFFPASIFLHRYLDDWGLDKGRTRTLLVMLLASVVAYGTAYLVDLFFA